MLVASTVPIALPDESVASIAKHITLIDVEHRKELQTLATRRFQNDATALVFLWALPMAAWYAVGASAPRWRPLLMGIRQLREAGWTMRAIADEMNRRGLRTRSGAAWRFEYVRNVLKAA